MALNRTPKEGDFVYAMSSAEFNDFAARRGIVSAIEGDVMHVDGPDHAATTCFVKGAIVIPPEEYDEEERELVKAILAGMVS